MIEPWRKIAEPHEDIRKERFDPAVFAADLGILLRDEGPIDYRDPVTFFKKTYLTDGLSNLLLDALHRLSGKRGGEAVVQVQTPFGGGKTHVVIALYHLMAHPDQIHHLPSIQDLLEQAELERVPECRIAALIGTALDPHGRETEDGIRIRTLWGEMAYQLGGSDLYHRVQESDEAQVAPGTDTLLRLLDATGPVIILVDEILEYATKVGGVTVGEGTLLGQTLAFLQEFSTVAANRPQTMLVGALPSSYLERFDASAQKAFQQLNKIFGRLEQIRTPVEGAEIYEILRRRLFEDVGSEAQRREIAEAYWDYYQAHAGDLPRKVREVSYRERMVRAYPFHPELVDILYERWGSLPNFQRTRGVLRLLAMVVGDLYKRGSNAGMIQPAHINLSNSRIRREFVNLVDNAYETVVGSDIAGHAAKAPQIDQELGGEYARERIAEGLATSIFLYSHTGGTDKGAVLPQLRLSILHPEMAPALVADALDRLVDRRPYYLYEDPKWRFDKVANLNKILVEREDAIKSKEIRTRIRSTLGDLVGQRTFRRTYLWPQEDRDVTDDRRLGLVVVDLDYPAGDKGTRAFITAVLKQHGEAFRNYRNTLVFLVPDRAEIDRASEAARNLLALESIAADYGGSDRLTDKQQENLEKDLSNARSALPQIVYQVYRHIFIPAEGEEWLHFDMGMQLLKGDRSLSHEVWEHLVGRDRILERLDPHLIRGQRWTLWPEPEQPLAVSQLRDYFARYTQLPMLASDEVLLQTIVRGVEIKLFGYGQRASEAESFSPLYFGQPVSPIELEIADTAWLVPPDVAQEQLLSAIAGHVLDEGNVPLSGVTVRLSPGGQAVTTGVDGEFAFDNLSPGTYTLAPSKAGYTFSPSSRSIGLVGEDVVGLEFVGSEVVGPPVTYELRGRVQTDEGLPLSHVRLAIDPPVAGDVTSDGQGEYLFRGLQEGTYRVRPEKAGYGFKPEELSVAVVGDLSGQDFIATKDARGAQQIEIHTRLPWEKWYDFYSDVLDPLMSVGAEISVHVRLNAEAEQDLDSDLIERLHDSVQRYDEDAEVEAE
jgi:predicted AAA+ superfamily ATPase